MIDILDECALISALDGASLDRDMSLQEYEAKLKSIVELLDERIELLSEEIRRKDEAP